MYAENAIVLKHDRSKPGHSGYCEALASPEEQPPEFCYIFTLENPLAVDVEVKYVGASVWPERFLVLQTKSISHELTELERWVRWLRHRNLKPSMYVLEKVIYRQDVDLWRRHRKHWIKELKRRGHKLLNGNNGGSGKLWQPLEVREKAQAQIVTQATRDQISKSSRGVKRLSHEQILLFAKYREQYQDELWGIDFRRRAV